MIAVKSGVTNLHCTNTTTLIQCFFFLHAASAQIMRQTVWPDEKNKDCKTSKNYAQIKNNCDKELKLHHWLRLSAVFSQYDVKWHKRECNNSNDKYTLCICDVGLNILFKHSVIHCFVDHNCGCDHDHHCDDAAEIDDLRDNKGLQHPP